MEEGLQYFFGRSEHSRPFELWSADIYSLCNYGLESVSKRFAEITFSIKNRQGVQVESVWLATGRWFDQMDTHGKELAKSLS